MARHGSIPEDDPTARRSEACLARSPTAGVRDRARHPGAQGDARISPPFDGRVAQCAICGQELHEPFGWCENCRATLCPTCGAEHFCMPTCRAAGCHAGLCVRLVRDGAVAPNSWGMREET
jgi:hypothetical protein